MNSQEMLMERNERERERKRQMNRNETSKWENNRNDDYATEKGYYPLGMTKL